MSVLLRRLGSFALSKEGRDFMRERGSIGYDGQPPEFRQKRGSEVRDSKTGEIIREGEMSPHNINVDRLAWLLAHKRITQTQHDAGERLQHDAELAETIPFTKLEGGRGGGGMNLLPDIKCDAIDRVNRARAAVGHTGWRIIEMVALRNISLEKAGAILRVKPSSMTTGLMVALDALASHYGMTT